MYYVSLLTFCLIGVYETPSEMVCNQLSLAAKSYAFVHILRLHLGEREGQRSLPSTTPDPQPRHSYAPSPQGQEWCGGRQGEDL